MGWHQEAEEKGLQGPACPLQNRLLFHLAHRLNDENKLMMHHQKLADTTLDQLSLASIHYLRNRAPLRRSSHPLLPLPAHSRPLSHRTRVPRRPSVPPLASARARLAR